MAAITAAVVGVGALALSATQYAGAQKDKKEAKAKIDAFQQQDLVNPFKNLTVSTLKADQATDANLSRNASSVDALQRGGTRAVLGGIPRLSEANVLLQNLISQDIERQDQERQRLIAQGEANLQGVRENRELGALQGYGQQLQSARQDSATALGNIASSALGTISALDNSDLLTKKPPVDQTPEVYKAQTQTAGLYNAPPIKPSLFDTPNFSFSDFNFNS